MGKNLESRLEAMEQVFKPAFPKIVTYIVRDGDDEKTAKQNAIKEFENSNNLKFDPESSFPQIICVRIVSPSSKSE